MWYKKETAEKILKQKYYHEGEDFDAFVTRVSSIFTDEIKPKIAEALRNADFFPAGRSLYGAGSIGKFKSSMSNCYILPSPEDNIESIFDRASKMGRIFSYGGGVGMNISSLRPNGAEVHNSAKTSTGPISFMEVYASVANTIGANNRRAALMLAMDCDHPDIVEFIEVKQNINKINSANISILFTDDFMRKLDKIDDVVTLKFEDKEYGKINAKELFNYFAETAWDWGEPGAIFIDNVRQHHFLSQYDDYVIEVSNPCAEYFGNAYNSCNLGSINLYNCVDNKFTVPTFNFEKFKGLVRLGVNVLDEILSYGYDMQPLEENRKCIDDWGAIGLGVFGFADMLAAMNVVYGSQESVELSKNIFSCMLNTAVIESAKLAGEWGPFQEYNYAAVSTSPMWSRLNKEAREIVEEKGLRHGSLISIAPTGTISTMCGLSGGIEPLFRLNYERTTHAMEESGQTFNVFAKSLSDYMDSCRVSKENVFTNLPESFITSDQIPPLKRIMVQSAIQFYVDNAISSTINLQEGATVEEVEAIFKTAWITGCKGITVFRNNCSRPGILMEQKTIEKSRINFDSIEPDKRGVTKVVDGKTVVGHTACVKNLYTTVNQKDGHIFEVFTNAKTGCKSNIGAITRLASLALRCGVKVEEVVSELKSDVCPACNVLQKQGNKDINNSCGACIGEAIAMCYDKKLEPNIKENNLECPNCGSKTLRPEGRCFNCFECGWSKCE